MSCLLTPIGTLLKYDSILAKVEMKGIRKIKNIFSITTIGHNKMRKTITQFNFIKIGNEKYIQLPRMASFKLQKVGIIEEIKNTIHQGEDNKLFHTAQLTSNQSLVLNHLVNNIYTEERKKKGNACCILEMKPGYGKTYLSLGVIEAVGKKTLIVVPNTYLLRQWVEVLSFNFPDKTIGTYYGTEKKDGDIIVSIVNSAIKYPSGKLGEIGLTIYDEVHMYCSKSFSKVFRNTQAQCVMGLTATPRERLDGFNPIANWQCGEVINAAKLEGWDPGATTFTCEVTRIRYYGSPTYTKTILSEAGVVSVPLMINQIVEDPAKNALIVEEAVKLYREGHNVFIFSDRRTHLEFLALRIRELNISYEAPELNDVLKLMGGSTDEDIENAKKIGRIVLTTYQYSGTGVSINKMDSLILATSRKSNMKQILGRIFRLGGNSAITRKIIDIVDSNTTLSSQYYSRKKAYLINYNANIIERKVFANS